MKNTLLLFVFLIASTTTFSQSNSINYKALVKDDLGNVMSNELINVRLSILEGVTTVYQEQYTQSTDVNGIIILNIGEGSVTIGVYNTIDWSLGSQSLKTEISIPGFGWEDLGTTDFKSVPYALHALSVENAAFKTEGGVTSNINLTDDFVFGSTQLDGDGDTTHDNRMFFDKSIGAFRAGGVESSRWDESNRGVYSTAFGFNTTASGDNSIATGRYAHASGLNSTAMGNNTAASGQNSTTLGNETIASGDNSTAMGFFANASGFGSIAIGNNAAASGQNSAAMGNFTEAKSFVQTTIGSFNTNTETPISTVTFAANDRLFVIGNGADNANRSDALVMLKNGSTQLNGLLTLDDNNGNGFTFPNVDGTINQVLETDGAGTLTWANGATDSPFSNTANVISGGDTDDDFVFGSTQLDDDGDITHDKRMFFDKSKGAFRAGIAEGTEWDDANVGNNSIALGSSSTASGNNSFSAGHLSVSSGGGAVSFGVQNTSSGDNAMAFGAQNSAIGYSSMAFGASNSAIGYQSTAFGIGNSVYSKAETAFGYWSTIAQNGNDIEIVPTDRLFVIGNGDNTTRSDALVMLKNGNTQLNGLLTLDDNNGNGFTFPNVDGTVNQVLETDGAGTLSWSSGASLSPFSKTANVISGGVAGDNFVFGSSQLDNDTGTTTDDSRMYYTKGTAAFRVGSMFGDGWDVANVGLYSVGMGRNAVASGNYSVAIGDNISATGEYSLAMGRGTSASGDSSTAFGFASNAESYGQTTIGLNGTLNFPNSATSYVSNDRLFIIGNGVDPANRSDALVMLKNGNTTLNGDLTLNGRLEGDLTVAGILTITNPSGFDIEFPSVNSGIINSFLVDDGSGVLDWTTLPTVTGTSNYISKFSGVTNSPLTNSLIYDNGTNVGIGTTTPSSKLSITGDANLNDGIASGTALRVNGTEALFYNGTQFSWGFGGTANYFADKIGIGEPAPVYTLDVKTSSSNYVAQISNTSVSSFSGGLKIKLGVSSPTSNNNFIGFFNVGDNLRGRIRGSATGVTYLTTSDGRLKTKITDITKALDLINEIQPRKYEYKSLGGVEEYGFIAQELQPIYPQAVSGSPDSDIETDPMMVDYGRLTPLLTAGIIELREEVENLKEKNKKLTVELSKYTALEERLSALENNASKKNDDQGTLTALNNK